MKKPASAIVGIQRWSNQAFGLLPLGSLAHNSSRFFSSETQRLLAIVAPAPVYLLAGELREYANGGLPGRAIKLVAKPLLNLWHRERAVIVLIRSGLLTIDYALQHSIGVGDHVAGANEARADIEFDYNNRGRMVSTLKQAKPVRYCLEGTWSANEARLFPVW